jgi:hypothetical protein
MRTVVAGAFEADPPSADERVRRSREAGRGRRRRLVCGRLCWSALADIAVI